MAKKYIGKWNGVPIYQDLLKKGTRRSGQKLTGPKFIVAHDTGNQNSTAQNNVDYYKNTYNIDINQTASAHFFVDDKECVICVPLNEKAWHVLYNAPADNHYYGIDANDGAIGGEGCYFSNKERSLKALDNFARVLAYLANKYKIDYKTEMPGHQDIQSDKQDPGNLLQACGLGRSTSNLDKHVAKYIDSKAAAAKPAAKPAVKKASKKTSKKAPKTTWNWEGEFTANTLIKVRRKPGLKAEIVDKNSWIQKGEYVPIYSVTKKDNYWWAKFRYPTNPKAGYFYCAIAKITDKDEKLKNEKALFGKIKYK